MLLRPEQLPAHLARSDKPLASLYVVHGDEPLLTIEAGDAIRAAAKRQGFTERELLVVGAHFHWEELFAVGGNLSLFGGDKLIDLRIPSGKPGRDGSEALQRYSKQQSPGVMTLITLPKLDWKTKKAAWLTALGHAGVVLECNAPPLAQLPTWLAERLKSQQQTASRETLGFIAAHVEGNLLAAHQEIQKLGLLYPPGELSMKQVSDAVLNVSRYDIEDLREALKNHDLPRAARTLDGLESEGAALPLVLWALAMEARAAKSIRALQQAARIDRIIKGVAQGDVWDEFLQLALRLTRATP